MLDVNSRVDQGPSTSPDAIRAKIASYSRQGYDSPLLAYSQAIYDLGVQYNVDPAFFCAICNGENNFGMSLLLGNGANSAWNPYTGTGSYNWTSISNAFYGGWPVPGSRWGQYPDIRTGIEAFFKLITLEYYAQYNQRTIGEILWGVGGTPYTDGVHAYAPASENPPGYAQSIVDFMNSMAAAPPGPPGPPPIFMLPSSAMLLLLGSVLAIGAAVGIYYVHRGGF